MNVDNYIRFRRMKKTGLFYLDEFCAITGYPAKRAVKILKAKEKEGEILQLGEDYYLLKPRINKCKIHYDWEYNRERLQYLLMLIPADNYISRKEIAARSGLSDSTITRYLKALMKTRHIVRLKVHTSYYYLRIKNELGEIPSHDKILNKSKEEGICRNYQRI